MDTKKKGCAVLFVCLGNICRSPMAEGLLKKKIDTDIHFVDSAGLDHYHLGEPPCKLTRDICAEHNCPIDHRARLFTPRDFDRFDRIYVMDADNLRQVLRMARSEADRQKVALVLDELYPGEHLDVPDPYMSGRSLIHVVYDMLDRATDRIAGKINKGEC